eukprot:CAMPEP_0176303160 /NCGR_PEP_ID=MMETSP0121_2-20121125/61759_1 /TAXON_ID=160619 /ORGANISM="Kryptoperidinium foliaceum, Strain CCMP 1326" /LENGTH=395 /DNA_ID=CAMNT_0017644701 /DNA_START=542 /DNA_END=1727 /DNA_ORIENTATION=+
MAPISTIPSVAASRTVGRPTGSDPKPPHKHTHRRASSPRLCVKPAAAKAGATPAQAGDDMRRRLPRARGGARRQRRTANGDEDTHASWRQASRSRPSRRRRSRKAGLRVVKSLCAAARRQRSPTRLDVVDLRARARRAAAVEAGAMQLGAVAGLRRRGRSALGRAVEDVPHDGVEVFQVPERLGDDVEHALLVLRKEAIAMGDGEVGEGCADGRQVLLHMALAADGEEGDVVEPPTHVDEGEELEHAPQAGEKRRPTEDDEAHAPAQPDGQAGKVVLDAPLVHAALVDPNVRLAPMHLDEACAPALQGVPLRGGVVVPRVGHEGVAMPQHARRGPVKEPGARRIVSQVLELEAIQVQATKPRRRLDAHSGDVGATKDPNGIRCEASVDGEARQHV